MVFGLPAIGEGTWGQKILDSINAVKATADAAQPSATLDAGVTAVDANAASALRVQQDARHSTAYAGRTSRAKHAPAFGLYFPEAEGALGNGVADDGAALQAAATLAQTNGGTLHLGPYTYLTSTVVTTAQSFSQPAIRGSGMRYTTLSRTTAGPVVKIVGGSGQLSGGVVADLQLSGTTATGIEFSGCDGVVAERVRFADLATGVLFHNDAAGTFTEFNLLRDCVIESTVTTAAEYKVTSGNDSFHGSGFRDTLIVQKTAATGPSIKIGAGCNVYNAPFDLTFFATTPARALILISTDAARIPTTTGTIRGESTGTLIDSASTVSLHHAGQVQGLSEGFKLGAKFVRADRVQRNSNGTVSAVNMTQTSQTPVPNTAAPGVAITDALPDGAYLAHVYLVGANYYYDHLVYVFRDQYAAGGSATILATGASFNTAGYGAPTYSVSGSKLYALNTAYPADGSVVAKVSISSAGATNFGYHPI